MPLEDVAEAGGLSAGITSNIAQSAHVGAGHVLQSVLSGHVEDSHVTLVAGAVSDVQVDIDGAVIVG
ncbi:hypothetical protein [Sphaerisporangium krabiense]|uniref:Uncharacterized protein n=1 Tax=Sphaerisporangium krabiense TaxID=763782 RepID=A0A7W8Z0I4_9ACTN|nr:hypothetical protein [Sphaerisporangium krabiense]MBB5625151.1 hypothetical protein [Sphaerisporangium krabiense]